MPEEPTWYRDIRPILVQYADVFPIMSNRLIDLADYDSVVAHLALMKFSFSLPRENPNSMPVSRDLSANKRTTILKWLDSKDGVKQACPLRGEAPGAPGTRRGRDGEALGPQGGA